MVYVKHLTTGSGWAAQDAASYLEGQMSDQVRGGMILALQEKTAFGFRRFTSLGRRCSLEGRGTTGRANRKTPPRGQGLMASGSLWAKRDPSILAIRGGAHNSHFLTVQFEGLARGSPRYDRKIAHFGSQGLSMTGLFRCSLSCLLSSPASRLFFFGKAIKLGAATS